MIRTSFHGTLPFLATLAVLALLAAAALGLARQRQSTPERQTALPENHLAGQSFHWDRATWEAVTSLGF